MTTRPRLPNQRVRPPGSADGHARAAQPGSALVTSTDVVKLEAAFVDAVRAAKARDPATPVLVVVGSHLQHIYLRRRLAHSLTAVANVRFVTLMDLAGELGLPASAQQASHHRPTLPLPDGAHVPLLEQVIAEHRSHDRASSAHGVAATGMVHAVAATLRDLREGGVPAPLVARAAARPWTGALATIAAAHLAALEPFSDATRRAEEAAAASVDQAAAAVQRCAPGTRSILVYGIYDANALQLRMLDLLARVLPARLFVPWSASAEPFAFVRRTVDRLRRRGLQVECLDDGAAGRGRRSARAVFSCADRQAETEETARRVLEDLAAGVPAAEIAILHRMDPVYDELICGVLDRAGVPHYRSAGQPVRRSAVGRAAINLLQLLYGEPRRGPLLELLSLPGIDLSWIESAAAGTAGTALRPRPARWEALSKELGLVSGWDEFDSVLAFHEEHAARGDADERSAEAVTAARELRAVVRGLAGVARQALAATSWQQHGRDFLGLLARLLPHAVDTPAMAAIGDRVRKLAVLDRAVTRRGAVAGTAERFLQAADTAVRQAIVSGGYFQRSGVFVGNVMSSRLLRFRRVYLTGCAERTFPPVVRQDPLLLDVERQRINGSAEPGSYLPLKGERLDEERLLFELACQAATERLTLSYPRRGTSSTNVRLPSSFLLEEVGDLAGGFLSAAALEHNAGRWYRRMPARIGFDGAGADDALRALDESDLRWHVLEQGGGGKGAVAAVQPLWANINAVRAQRKARGRLSFGPFDGIVPAAMVAAHGTLDRGLTATALEDFAVCPYRFFLSRVLGIRARAEPEQTLEIAPLQRGNLVHAILDELLQRFLAGGAPWPEYLNDANATLHEIVERHFAELPAGITGLPLSWNLIREQVAEELAAYLDAERRHAGTARAGAGWQPIAAEQEFDGVPIQAGKWRLRLSGRIDRIDRSPDGLRIVDYKTGAAAREPPDGYREGRSLQLPAYLYAAANDQPEQLHECTAELHYVSERAAYVRVRLSGAQLAGDARFTEVLAAMAEAIASGAFFYQPGEGRAHCRWCDYRDVCHTRVADYARRKSAGSETLMEPFQRIADTRHATPTQRNARR